MNNQKGSTAAHQDLQARFIIAVSKEFMDLRVLTYTNGMFRAFDDPDRIIRAGQKGVLDLCVFGHQKYLWFDTKTGNAVFTKEQRYFAEDMQYVNGDKNVALKLKSIEQGLAAIREHFYG